jgi:hypothetical protein
MCKYGTDNKAHYAIHCNSKRHCQLVGTPYQAKTVTKKVFTDVMEDVTKYNDMKKFDMDLQATTFLQEITKLKEQLQRQEEANTIKEQMTALRHELELLKEKNKYQECLLAEKDKMIQYLMTVKEAPIQVIQAPQPIQQVLPQSVSNEVIPKVSKKQLKEEEEEDEDSLNKKYLVKHCLTDSINFCKDLEVIDDDYSLFMSGEYVPMKKVMNQILERNLKRMTLHEMGVVVLPNDKIYTYTDEWTESSKGLHDIRNWISKQLQTYLIEDETYEGMEYVTDEDYQGQKPTNKQAEQYTDATQVILQLQSDRHEIDKEIKLIIQKYSTK